MNKTRAYVLVKPNKGLTYYALPVKAHYRQINHITYLDNYKESFQCTKRKVVPEID